MHQISFLFFQRGITPEWEITRTRKKCVAAIFPWGIYYIWNFKTLACTVHKIWHASTSRPRGQQLLTWGTVSSMYKYNSKLQAIVETTGTGTETKIGFCITKTPYEDIFWHSMALNCEASSPIQLKFKLHWDFMPVLVASKFEEYLNENEHNFFPPLKGT